MDASDMVKSIMTKNVITIDVNRSLVDVKKVFQKNKIRHLPVTSDGRLVGMISQTDILRISFGNNFEEEDKEIDEAIFEMLSINQIMKSEVTTIEADQPIRKAAEIFTEKEFHALPVLMQGELVGILTTTDLINYLLEIVEMSEIFEKP